MNWISLARTPEAFHGARRRSSFFEGWYVKLVSADLGARLALIPGVFLGAGRGAGVQREAFVQVLDGLTGASAYHVFGLDEFTASDSSFQVRVGPNHFDSSGVTVDLPATDGIPALSGRIEYTEELRGWPVTWRSPGAMGWYGWLPIMECYHGVVGFGHGLSGSLGATDFTGGRGYIEKDWGQAFPSAYVWMATNHFSDPSLSLSGSIAVIPWRRSSFRGFLVGLRSDAGLQVFATHAGSRVEHLGITHDRVDWTLCSRDGHRLELGCTRARGGLLAAPVRTEMHHRVEETIDAQVRLRLWSPQRQLLIDDTGLAAGLEVHGDLDALLTMS